MENHQDSIICCLQETVLNFKATHGLKMNGCKEILHSGGKQKRAEIVISDRTDFSSKTATRDK